MGTLGKEAAMVWDRVERGEQRELLKKQNAYRIEGIQVFLNGLNKPDDSGDVAQLVDDLCPNWDQMRKLLLAILFHQREASAPKAARTQEKGQRKGRGWPKAVEEQNEGEEGVKEEVGSPSEDGREEGMAAEPKKTESGGRRRRTPNPGRTERKNKQEASPGCERKAGGQCERKRGHKEGSGQEEEVASRRDDKAKEEEISRQERKDREERRKEGRADPVEEGRPGEAAARPDRQGKEEEGLARTSSTGDRMHLAGGGRMVRTPTKGHRKESRDGRRSRLQGRHQEGIPRTRREKEGENRPVEE
eukprot:2361553-Heterocapsa_arctica.AAC.1